MTPWSGLPASAINFVIDSAMKAQPLVSVVTPFYNTQEYLAECIESVLNQTYDNWEFILVDNCSTDGSGVIAAKYMSRFPGKIRVLQTKSFLSQLQNYNFALTCIAPDSKYCKMVQADDWLFPDCIRSMVEVAEAHPSVGIVLGYELEDKKVRLDGLPYNSAELPGQYICRLYFLDHVYLFGSHTSLLMRSDLVRSKTPFYEERYVPFVDGHACFDLLKKWNFGFVHQVLTYTRRQPGSTISPLASTRTDLLVQLVMLVAHGRDWLSEKEYAQCLALAERRYFLYVARLACSIRQKETVFWEFHKKALASADYDLNWRTLIKWIPRALIDKCWDMFWGKWDGILERLN
jgi:glycosyltransferase involved in cell wall biosynthesis